MTKQETPPRWQGPEIHGPKDLGMPGEEGVLAWARNQIVLAGQIVDNPGGGQVFAQQGIGQARAALAELDAARHLRVIALLHEAEDHAQKRDFAACRDALRRSQEMLSG